MSEVPVVEVVVVVERVYLVVELYSGGPQPRMVYVVDFYCNGVVVEDVRRVYQRGVGYDIGFEDDAFGQSVVFVGKTV